MPDDTTTTDASASTPAEVADQPAATPQMLTAEAVQQMIEAATQKAFNSGAAAARREAEAKQAKPKAEAKTDTKPNTDGDTLSILALRDAFDDAMGDLALSAKQKKFLRDRVMKERPDDVAAFVADAVDVMGVKTAQLPTNSAAATKDPTQSQPQKPTVPAVPAPAVVPDREGEPAFRTMSEEGARDTWQAYVRRKGAVPGNPYDPRNRSVWRELRRRFEAEASISSIQLGARRG